MQSEKAPDEQFFQISNDAEFYQTRSQSVSDLFNQSKCGFDWLLEASGFMGGVDDS